MDKSDMHFGDKVKFIMKNYDLENYTQYVDKYEVRSYVESIDPDILVPLLAGPFYTSDGIDFDDLPAAFAIKCTKGSGRNVIVTDKSFINEKEIREYLDKAVDKRWNSNRERQYNFKGRIIVEENIGQDLTDYKFWCFNGEPIFIQTIFNRTVKRTDLVYDLNWNKTPYQMKHRHSEGELPPPKNLKQMISLARKLSCGFDFVRVDLYNIEGKIYFGELTFTPDSATFKKFKLYPDEYNYIMGRLLVLTKECDE